MAGDLNVNLAEPEGDHREEEIATALKTAGNRGHVVPLPSVTAPMVPVREDMEHCPVREGGEVLDRLHPRDRLLSLSKCDRPGPKA